MRTLPAAVGLRSADNILQAGSLTWIVALSADGAEPDRLRCANVLRESVRACVIDVLGLMVVSCECCITSVLSGQETCLLRDSMFLTQPGADSLCCCCSGQCLSTCTLPSRAAGAATCCWSSLSHCCGSCCCYDQFWNQQHTQQPVPRACHCKPAPFWCCGRLCNQSAPWLRNESVRYLCYVTCVTCSRQSAGSALFVCAGEQMLAWRRVL